MNRGLCILALSALLGLSWPRAGAAVPVDYELAIRSPHVWRGITLREFPVLNISATARWPGGFATQLWVGLDLGDGDGREGEIQEIDIDVSYTRENDRAKFTLGYIGLFFPGGISNTGEMYLRWQSKGLLAPRFEIFYNVDLLQDVFAAFSLSHRWDVAERWAPSLTTSVAYAGEEYAAFFGGSRAGLHHWGLNLDLDYRPRRTGLKLRLAYSQSFDGHVLPDQPVDFWGGVYLSIRQP